MSCFAGKKVFLILGEPTYQLLRLGRFEKRSLVLFITSSKDSKPQYLTNASFSVVMALTINLRVLHRISRTFESSTDVHTHIFLPILILSLSCAYNHNLPL